MTSVNDLVIHCWAPLSWSSPLISTKLNSSLPQFLLPCSCLNASSWMKDASGAISWGRTRAGPVRGSGHHCNNPDGKHQRHWHRQMWKTDRSRSHPQAQAPRGPSQACCRLESKAALVASSWKAGSGSAPGGGSSGTAERGKGVAHLQAARPSQGGRKVLRGYLLIAAVLLLRDPPRHRQGSTLGGSPDG